ncbi:hypothetical protein [Fimbriiglobus ruber]|uniref:Uncharacterized protein n=1 Tax=Fimbriiglobus ruber TaxID=1908690 RepID=A0A225DH93_9BACT|nr:hypothetical protein [Fimbriiglobus ruber]OWK35765.1 hypothetical protein FRUB_08328 [Fimbriiglobus ruber]
MTGVLRAQLTTLAATLADLKERVRVAVAGELARAVSGAVSRSSRPSPPAAPPRRYPSPSGAR